MRYLLINGSPRKGNTWLLVERIKEEIAAIAPDASFDEVQLAQLGLPFCTGCSLCFRRGMERCPHHETVRRVLDLVDASDGVVFAFTTFNMQPNALAKNLIDHLCALLHRPRFFTKKALAVSTTGGVGVKKAVKYVAGALRGMGFNRCYGFPVNSYSWNAFVIDERLKGMCARVAARFHRDVASGRARPPGWLAMIPYNLFRGMSLSYVAGMPYETADGAHWADPVRAKRAYDPAVPVPFYKKLFGGLFYAIGKLASKRVVITYRR